MTTLIVTKDMADWMQRGICQKYIRTNTVECSLGDINISFLPESAISALTTYSNIIAMVYQDTHIQQVANFPNHAKDSYITRIFNKSRKLFVAAVSEGLSMNFVRVLMRGGKFGNENLSFANDTKPRDEYNKVWPKEDTQKFLEAQKLVCAPLLTISEFDQLVAFRSSILIVEAKLRQDGDVLFGV
jgi:hypothetical protein